MKACVDVGFLPSPVQSVKLCSPLRELSPSSLTSPDRRPPTRTGSRTRCFSSDIQYSSAWNSFMDVFCTVPRGCVSARHRNRPSDDAFFGSRIATVLEGPKLYHRQTDGRFY